MAAEPTTLIGALRRAAERDDRGFTWVPTRGPAQRAPWSQVWTRACEVASALVEDGLTAGERVGIALSAPGDFIHAFFGVQLAGGVPVPMASPQSFPSRDTFVELAGHILAMAGARRLVVTSATRAGLITRTDTGGWQVLALTDLVGDGRAPTRDPSEDDLALIQCSSGSTARPRGIRLTHRCVMANIQASTHHATPLHDEDVVVSWLPLYHDLGLISGVLGPVVRRIGSVLFTPVQFMAEPALWLRLISEYGGSVSWAPSPSWRYAAATVTDAELAGLDLRTWRVAGCAAEPVRREALEAFARRFAPVGFSARAFVTAYGLAEFSLGATFSPPGRGLHFDEVDPALLSARGEAIPAEGGGGLSFAGCGFPLHGHGLRITTDEGELLPERRVGRIQLRGPSRSDGYEGAQAPPAPGSEWLDTGDRGYIAGGELFVCGRSADLLRWGGKVMTAEAYEGALGAQIEDHGGRVAALQPPDGPLTLLVEVPGRPSPERLAELRERLRAAALQTGLPAAEILLLPPGMLPRTTSGKLRRHQAGQLLREGKLRPLAPTGPT